MKMTIEPVCHPDGEEHGLCHCAEEDATRWMVLDTDGHPMGTFTSRDLAEAYVNGELKQAIEILNRRQRFTWNDGDVEHHNEKKKGK